MKRSKTSKNARAREIRIAYIGGGSRGWAHIIMADLTLCGRLTGEMRLYDIDRPMALLNARWGRRLNQSPAAKSQWKYSAPRTLREALKGADIVFVSIQPGPIEMMGCDLDIPRKYGIIHPVGDTVGPAGICRSLRAVSEYTVIAEAIARYCPDAWVINYSNPMTILTRTLHKVFPDIKAFGCCHEVFGTQNAFVKLVNEHLGVKPKRHEIRLKPAGVNHFVWTTEVEYDGVDLIALYTRHWRRKGMARRIIDDEIEKMNSFGHHGQVTWDLFRRYGALPTGGERHLTEFVPFYARDEATLNRWGVKCTPYSYRVNRYREMPQKFRRLLADPAPFEIKRSDEEGVAQILALLGMGDLRTNVNLPNVGQIEGLPRGAVVETNAYFTRDSVQPEFYGRLPAGIEALVARAVSNQEIIVEAALNRDKHLAFQAVLNDSLMSLSTDTAWKMFREMLKATQACLPGWKI